MSSDSGSQVTPAASDCASRLNVLTNRIAIFAALFLACTDRNLCRPAIVAPSGNWFLRDPGLVLMVNGESADSDWWAAGSRWLQMVGTRSSYGFFLRSAEQCAADWVEVEIEGESVRHAFEAAEFPLCQFGYCKGHRLTLSWLPRQPRSRGTLRIGDWEQQLNFLAGRKADVELIAEIPAVCNRVAVIGEQLLCDHTLFRDGTRLHEWPRTSLVVSLGDGLVGEWGANSFRTWETSSTGAVLHTEASVTHSPAGQTDSIEVGTDGVLLDGAAEVTEIRRDADWGAIGSTSFPGDVVVLSNQRRLWLTNSGEHGLRACESPDGGACLQTSGLLASAGRDGIWFYDGPAYFGVLGSVDGGLRVGAEIRLGDLYGESPIDRGDFVLPVGVALNRRTRPVSRASAGTCLNFELEDGEFVPEVLPEVGRGLAFGDGADDLRWCQTTLDGHEPVAVRTFVYRRRSK